MVINLMQTYQKLLPDQYNEYDEMYLCVSWDFLP